MDQVICRVAIARQRQRVDPQTRKDRFQLLVEIVECRCSSSVVMNVSPQESSDAELMLGQRKGYIASAGHSLTH